MNILGAINCYHCLESTQYHVVVVRSTAALKIQVCMDNVVRNISSTCILISAADCIKYEQNYTIMYCRITKHTIIIIMYLE